MNADADASALGNLHRGNLSSDEEAAIAWSIRLSSEDASDNDRAAFDRWLAQSPEHKSAWQHLSASLTPFRIAQHRQRRRGALAEHVLGQSISRRRVVSHLVGLGVGSIALASIANRFVPLRQLTADHLTWTGEIKKMALPRGAVTLGPRTALNISADGNRQLFSLLSGEVLIETREPFLLRIDRLALTASRGSFIGRFASGTELVSAADSSGAVWYDGVSRRLEPEQSFSLSGGHAQVGRVSARAQTGWTEGKLFVDDERLDNVVDRLRPYFAGIIRLDPAITAKRMTGVLPVDDFQLAIATVARALDLSIRWVTPLFLTMGQGES